MPASHIFIVGWGNTGTRLIVRILHANQYQGIAPENNTHDYRSSEFANSFRTIWWGNRDMSTLCQRIKDDIEQNGNPPQWVIKHGHLILMCDELKRWFPDCVIIALMRNPLDAILKNDRNFEWYNPNPTVPLRTWNDKLKVYKLWYDTGAPYINYYIRLEDLVCPDTKENTIKDLYSFLGIDGFVSEQVLNIINEPSATIGRWKVDISNPHECIDSEYLEWMASFGYIV